jgi:SWI/SNF-related matrix-associated actin-dependent regulator of chromatin subfamily A-like protein 1
MMTTLSADQAEGALWLLCGKNRLLGDEPGAGKTAQAIAACDHLGLNSILIIAPAIMVREYEAEFAKFSCYRRQFQVITSKKMKLADDSKVVVCSYEMTVNKNLKSRRYDMLLIDEAHFLKNPKAKRTKRVYDGKYGLANYADRVVSMTGSPMPNHPGELWTVLYTSGATKLKYQNFLNQYCVMEPTLYGDRIIGVKNAEELKGMLEGIMLRRMANLDIGVVFETIPLAPNKYSLYNDRPILEKLDNEIKKRVLSGIELAILNMEDLEGLPQLRKHTGLEKANLACERIKIFLDSGIKKVVIFAHHQEVYDIILNKLSDYGVVEITGRVTGDKRKQALDRYRTDDSIQVALLSITAASIGITLTEGNYVFFVEQDWSIKNNEQAFKRVYRKGQTKTTFVYFFYLKGSCDELIAINHARKLSMQKEVEID